MDTLRRSPRHHPSVSYIVPRSLKVKAAQLSWEENDGSLLVTLLSCMESNRRWRFGIFPATNSRQRSSAHSTKVKYYDEIARAMFSRHPNLHYRSAYRKKPASFARAVKDKLESFSPSCRVDLPRTSGKSVYRSVQSVSLLSYRSTEAWTHLRQSTFGQIGNHCEPLWLPSLPLEIQYIVLRLAIAADRGLDSIDLPVAANLSLVNRTWCQFIEPFLYRTVTIRSPSRYRALFDLRSSLARPEGPVNHTKILKLFVPPPDDYMIHSFFVPAYSLHRHIPEVHYDVASSRNYFPIVKRLPRETHVQEFSNYSSMLYPLLLDMRTTKLHLTMSFPMSEGPEDELSLWGEVMSGHIAVLKLMVHLRELIIDGALYLTLLPKCVHK
ncbi:uncharacterized protein EI90DRAFT_2217245 [Cantharellus anzutake]|uniref:uncharacterized protein n=1 Tax=Cantharellus anzutake TaxID=1750568 RepID=UPI001906DF45|nr:uncharacterized protein EI90DRAFT_2626442 [Cantharellus anzutake]XP_038911878.1 uncharacterized protein EI90DRAFT_2217245 [Cantharellus anzutake]KAF8319850.1 hypothetical protein EI90DRAFT_2626442 [Cantharellus anzutake]KAF8324882.1 hypothetical protein EI90DRAFT_2217245 [Cantharellus anzutake]